MSNRNNTNKINGSRLHTHTHTHMHTCTHAHAHTHAHTHTEREREREWSYIAIYHNSLMMNTFLIYLGYF